MKRPVKGLIAAFAAVSILTACTPQDATTTAAQEGPADGTTTTQQGTTPSTTAASTQPATAPSTTAAGTQAAATTSSSPATGDRVAEIMNRSTAAMEDLDNYRVTSESSIRLLEEELTTTSVMDMYPMLEANKMTSEISGMTMENYTVGDMVYTKGLDGSWMKMKIPSEGTGEEPGADFTPMTDTEYAEYFVMEETAEGYRVKTKRPITMEEMQRIGNIPQEETDMPGLGEEETDLTVELDMLISRDYYTSEMVMTMIMATDEGTVESVINTTMSHFNELPPFQLPAEAEEAEEVEIPGMPMMP